MKSIYILIVALLATVYSTAQSISPAQWENIVDYVTIEMAKSAMEKTRKGKSLDEGEQNDYDVIMGISASIDNPQYDVFCSHLNNWQSTNKELIEKIQIHKNQQIDIQTLFTPKDINDKFWVTERANELCKEVNAWVEKQSEKVQSGVETANSIVPQNNVGERKSTNSLYKNLESEKAIDKKLSLFSIAVLSSFLTILTLLVVQFFRKKRMRNFIIDSVLTSERVNEKIRLISSTHNKPVYNNGNSNTKSMTDKYFGLENRVKDLEKKLSVIDNQLSQLNNQLKLQETKGEPDCVNSLPVEMAFARKYLGRLSDGIFRRSSESRKDDYFFYMNEATGEFYFDNDSLQKAKARGSVVFENTSEFSGVGISDALNVETVEPGKVEQVDGGEWKVIKKTIIRFE